MIKTTLNINGKVVDLKDQPLIMGIINLTPDSFYAGSRCSMSKLEERIEEIIAQGGDIIDLGAYSSRPNAEDISIAEERSRLEPALAFIAKHYPQLKVSVDTFRSEVAKMSVEEYGVGIINDISAGQLDKEMFPTVAKLNVPYILMHMKGTPQTMQAQTDYEDLITDVTDYLIRRTDELRSLGLHDIILDLGFGFSKTLAQNYELLSAMPQIQEVLEEPMLVGISRKSMIYKALELSPEESLNGTTALNAVALMNGANILRVHDVKEAVECRRLLQLLPRKQDNIIERIYNPSK